MLLRKLILHELVTVKNQKPIHLPFPLSGHGEALPRRRRGVHAPGGAVGRDDDGGAAAGGQGQAEIRGGQDQRHDGQGGWTAEQGGGTHAKSVAVKWSSVSIIIN